MERFLNQAYNAGGLQQANAIQGGVIGTSAPRTISSAIGRVDSLNERLSEIAGKLTALSDQIGGPRAVSGAANGVAPIPCGAVHRLNEAVDCAHTQAGDIDELLNSISRVLG